MIQLKCMKKFKNVVCVSETAKESVKKVIGDPGNLCVKYSPLDYLSIIEKSNVPINRPQKLLFVALNETPVIFL